MFEKLRVFFERSVSLTDEQFEFIKTQFISKKVRKNEFLMREGEVARYGIFVASGCLRTYTIDDKGKEHIIQFSVENWWTGDQNSYMTGTPTPYFIEALEDSEVILFDHAAFQRVLSFVPGIATHYLEGLQRHAAAKNKRIVSWLSASAEERYEEFINAYPTIAQRVPQHMIASYLGISPETISRIRKQHSHKQ